MAKEISNSEFSSKDLINISIFKPKAKPKNAKEELLDKMALAVESMLNITKELNNYKSTNQEDLENEYTQKIEEKKIELATLRDKIGNKFLKAIGQVYQGVLIPESMSIRQNGKVYRYKCQYPLSFDQVIRDLYNNKSIVLQNIKGKVGADIMEIIEKCYCIEEEQTDFGIPVTQSTYNILTSNKTFAQKEIILDLPIPVIDLNTPYYSSEDYEPVGDIKNISIIKINSNGINFIAKKQKRRYGNVIEGEYDESSLSNRSLCSLIISKYEDLIKDTISEMFLSIEKEKAKINNLDKLIDDKMGKYLIAAELQQC